MTELAVCVQALADELLHVARIDDGEVTKEMVASAKRIMEIRGIFPRRTSPLKLAAQVCSPLAGIVAGLLLPVGWAWVVTALVVTAVLTYVSVRGESSA